MSQSLIEGGRNVFDGPSGGESWVFHRLGLRSSPVSRIVACCHLSIYRSQECGATGSKIKGSVGVSKAANIRKAMN